MSHSNLTFLFRNFFRNLSFSLITLNSLVVGITTALLLFIWVNYEISYNKSLVDHEQIFALLLHDEVEGEINTEDGTRIPLMDFLTNEVPEVEAITRIDNKNILLANGESQIYKSGAYADSSFFTVHVPDQMEGSTINNGSIAISKTLASELFKDTEAIGKTILVDHQTEFIVSAIFAPYPKNSSFHYIHFILPMNSRPPNADDWLFHEVKLFDPSSREHVEKKIDQKIAQLYPKSNTKSQLFTIGDWRLRWSFKNGQQSGGRIIYVVIFSITGLFVLIMACINYMNISTAQATRRMREIGVRKVNGATQPNLIRQFMTESLILTSIAAIISIGLAYLLLPHFNQLVGAQLILSFSEPLISIGLVSIILLTSLLAGSYPAWILSSFKPAAVLKSSVYSGNKGITLRKVLVIFQFTLSSIMIFCSLVTWQQTNFLLQKELGYDRHRVINIWMNEDLDTSFDNLHEQVQGHSAIESAAFAGASPMEVNGYGICNRVTNPLNDPFMFYGANIDEHVLTTLNFEIVAGRNFSSERASDSLNFIITQNAANMLGFENPIGQRITFNMFGEQEGEIVGVIKDFQHDDIHTSIKPVVFVFGQPNHINNMFVRYQEGKLDEALAHVQKTFDQAQPGIPLDFSFLDSDFETQLYQEKRLGNISIAFTIIAIIIACLGLFGLVLFNAQRRTKEIGIRKVLGATTSQVTYLLCRDFLPPVLYSFLFAFPIGYLLMQKYLADYTSRITISLSSFLWVAGLMIFILLITISHKSVQAAQQNPVDSLKTE